MTKDIDAAVNRWKAAGPLSEESLKLLLEMREAGMVGQPQDLLWAAYVRSLTPEQKAAMVALFDVVGEEEAFRYF